MAVDKIPATGREVYQETDFKLLLLFQSVS